MRIERTVRLAAGRQAVWRVVSDPANFARLLPEVTRFEREGSIRRGEGARWNLRLLVGAISVGGLVEVVEFDEGWEMAWHSVRGLEHRGRWRLRDAPGGGTDVTFRLIYSVPHSGSVSGTLAGFLIHRMTAPLVDSIVQRTLENLRAELDEGADALRQGPVEQVADALESFNILRQAGLVRALPPDQLLRMGLLLRTYGMAPAVGYATQAVMHPDEVAIVDELGELTFSEVEERTNALARGLQAQGITAGTPVGVLARNHRWFIEACVAIWKLGATLVLLNTSFSGPQLAEVARRERLRGIVYDEEFSTAVAAAARGRRRVIAWPESARPDVQTVESLIEANEGRPLPPPERPARTVILTSGTTGKPKGAGRSNPAGVGPAVALLSRMPLRQRGRTFIAAPLFHTWGFSQYSLGLLLGSTVVLQRRFDPEAALRVVEETRPDAMVAVPVMLQRIMELPARTRRRYDCSSLRIVGISGSALPADIAERWMDDFGDNLYNLYGSTEVAWATIATPADLRAAPGTAGRPPRRTVVRIYGPDDKELPAGESGRIFVGNEYQFEGYTGGGGKERLDGLMATGDVGHFDAEGRLFIDGRDDEMIVSGGENVYPREVEELLARHPAVREVAVVGVPDPQFGQALRAVVVKKGQLDEDTVKDYVRRNLARYKVPRQVEFLDRLPRNPAGKVLKRDLVAAASAEKGAVRRPARRRRAPSSG